MKRYVKIVCAALCLLIAVTAFCGCNCNVKISTYEEDMDYLYKKINDIPAEYGGYVLQERETLPPEGEYVELKEGADLYGEYPFNEGTLNIKRGETDGYEFSYGGLKKQLTAEYMETHSETFVKIEHVWDTYKENASYNGQLTSTDIKSVAVFDDRIFIVVSRWPRYFSSELRAYKNVPWHFYRWDLEKDELLYCGYWYTTKDTHDNVYSFYIKKVADNR